MQRFKPHHSALLAVAAIIPTLVLPGCATEGCLNPNAVDCTVPSPCTALTYTCEDGLVEVRVLDVGDERPGGRSALGSPGDILLGNDQITLVIDALDHPRYVTATGGGVVDMVTRGDDNDSLRQLAQAVGLVPDDGIIYTEMKLIEEAGIAGVQFRGHLQGRPGVQLATRYEVRSCEPGVRIRTEVVNGEAEPWAWHVSDGFYFGGREHFSFGPTVGAGYEHPSFGLSTITDVIAPASYVAAWDVSDGASYGAISCSTENLHAFHSEELTVAGTEVRVVQPREYEIFERFIVVTDGESESDVADLAFEAREQLFGEAWVTLSGQVNIDGDTEGFDALGSAIRASVMISEGTTSTPLEERIPTTHVVPDADGNFSVRVPTGRDYVMSVESFGITQTEANVTVGTSDVTADALEITAASRLLIDAKVDGDNDEVLAFIVPGDLATEEAVSADMLGHFETCAPLLGHPHGGTPACNRVLVDVPTWVTLPPGNYDVFATVGLFSTMAKQNVTVTAGLSNIVELNITTLDMAPQGTLSGDFHVHGGASFDSSVPEIDRVRSFLAARTDVVVATDHDVVFDYVNAMDTLAAHDRLKIAVGLETTGHMLSPLFDDSPYPKVIGHWNFWPMLYDPDGPWRGAPYDEFVEPGQLFTDAFEIGWPELTGVIQLNHPIGGSQLGRDFGWASALEFNLNNDIPSEYDGSGMSLYDSTPPGASFSNGDYHVQEVMNGTANYTFLQYRQFWFYLLNQGYLRGGTANSDTHSLTENVLGTPRTLVWSDTTKEAFDIETFNLAVRDGRMIGTNGPIIEAWISDEHGDPQTPSLNAFVPEVNGDIHIRITAAPWVPVDEVRVIVNGETMVTEIELDEPEDPFGAEGVVRFDGTIAMEQFVPSQTQDAWIVIEAGQALALNRDLDCDGIVDTGDHNGDGIVDENDVEGDAKFDKDGCLEEVGPLKDPDPPTDRTSREWAYRGVVPDGYPAAFTNPFLLDRDGGGFQGVSR